ncbi:MULTISPECIES: DUF6691 family protein [unclassified Pseudomonas]|uniref:DUF6691 family protein n=1 Tax=unclassified Pseudomonas TaxID=196821 RepID=UPI000BCD01E8|nr:MULTISPECIES: DUF6691 family protein [unclassified Pseudomonas]PVZ20604.1 hypothetical protein F474_01205 [Pseudomonas sp. URIL14HWK12:I12]PVZ27670.1 hypothetical protein F470_00860 [Pseudomonas sp. URIL14HWK12:I10]PVZ38559.1 hypothetical protein F472_01205 [Pseudomonas sp. URIL14HWK12:I11]SNZ02877.1 hypothetical protein SAMN05660463_00199 [Pseudomonas sp. URIL14HWK12:I9]
MRYVTALSAGLLFGLGLLLAGMADPLKVLRFLDIAGPWDPSLALVMAGAIGTALGPMAWARRRSRSLLAQPMQLPAQRPLDAPLVVGSLTFGVGWGIAGVCPGPALVLLAGGRWQVLVFVAAMLAGMAAFTWVQRWRS